MYCLKDPHFSPIIINKQQQQPLSNKFIHLALLSEVYMLIYTQFLFILFVEISNNKNNNDKFIHFAAFKIEKEMF